MLPHDFRWLLLLFALASTAPAAVASDDARVQVLAELAKISQASGGTFGVSALSVKTGERLQLEAGERFPMASTFKVAVAMKVLEQVDRGALSLDQVVPIDDANLSPGSGELKTTEADAAKTASLGKLVALMMRTSDNTATDHLLRLVGGPLEVTRYVQRLGIQGIDVSRSAAQLVADARGIKLPPPGQRTSKALAHALREVPGAMREKAPARFLEDPRDTATPDAMVALLGQLKRGAALSRSSTDFLIEQMENCRTSRQRLMGELPRGIVIAHKGGTLAKVATNDVGIIPLSWGRGELIVAIYLKGSKLPLAAQERSIANASREIYRYFGR